METQLLNFALKLVSQSSKKTCEKIPCVLVAGLGVYFVCKGITEIYSEYNKNLYERNLHEETMCGFKR